MKRLYIYGLRLHSGEYVHANGIDWQDAARNAGLRENEIKRSMPVGIVLTEAEREAHGVT